MLRQFRKCHLELFIIIVIGIIYTDEITHNESFAGMKSPKLYPNITKKEFDFIAANNGPYSCADLL